MMGTREWSTPLALLSTCMMLVGTNPTMAQSAYQKPPQNVLDILNAPTTPSLILNPTRDTLLMARTERYPSIADVSRPMLRLAGYRLDPRTNGPHMPTRVTELSILPVTGGEPRAVPLPPGAVSFPDWSPNGQQFVVTVTGDDGIGLWLGDLASGTLEEVPGVRLNAAFGDPIRWLPDGKTLLCKLIPADRGAPPVAPPAPPGPTIQESSGKAAPVRTYQDLLQNAHDEAVYDHYAFAQLAYIDLPTGKITPVGQPANHAFYSVSPDGQLILVYRIERPYSYLFTASSFPRSIEVWDRTGKVVHQVAKLPLQDRVPIEGVPTGPRNVRWMPNEAATLMWAEALDGGDPKTKVPHRDQLFTLAAPFSGEARPLWKTEHRFSGISFFEKRPQALVTDYDRDRRWVRTELISLQGEHPPRVIFDRSMQDRYGDPGSPLSRPNAAGQSFLWELPGGTDNAGQLILSGAGASPKGDRPFLAVLDLGTGKSERYWQCREGWYETATPLSEDGQKLLIRRESSEQPANYFVRTGDKDIALTQFPDPAPQLRAIKKQRVIAKRDDGVDISFTLYLPPDYKEGEKRPTIFWAYPREFNDPSTAGQVSGSTHRFTSISGYTHLFFLTQGYVIMDEVSIPIVGPPETANDSYVEQLVGSAKAAIDKAVEMGPVDRDRIGVGGHSYGAFMTANLLAHSDLFRAGIARSGAYNRTLTPFGFQNERRTFWEATPIYAKMSPFFHAHKINEPILMIHGEADNNSGTFPMQSERMYQAIRGNGGIARLVMLPYESHGYSARESIEHVLAEQIAWFDKYVKGAESRTPTESGAP